MSRLAVSMPISTSRSVRGSSGLCSKPTWKASCLSGRYRSPAPHRDGKDSRSDPAVHGVRRHTKPPRPLWSLGIRVVAGPQPPASG